MKHALSHEQINRFKSEALIQKLVAAIDEMVSLQLSFVIQHPSFKQLESLWRGLLHTIKRSMSSKNIRVRILDMSWGELSNDLNLSNNFRSSLLYRLINQQELNTLGGHPFGLLVVDHYISLNSDDSSGHDEIFTLQLLSELGQESLCPVVMGVASDFLQTPDLNVWSNPVSVQRILASGDFNDWRRLRSLPCSRFLCLTLPQILIRKPWYDTEHQFCFREEPVYSNSSFYLWGNSVFAFAGNVLSEFHRIHWFGFLRVADNGGAVVKATSNAYAARIKITDRLAEFYSDQGFIPLETCYLNQKLAFFNNRSVYKTTSTQDDMKIISMLQTTLIGCRFGHYLKLLIRENIGSYDSAETCEKQLNIWLQNYTSNVDNGSDEVLASYPLRKSRARITGNKIMGIYNCSVELQPQYQFDFIHSKIILKTDASEIKEIT